MAKDFSDVYEAIRSAEKEGRKEDVAKLVAYLEAESAKASEEDTYDPKNLVSSGAYAGTGAGAAAVGPVLAKKGMESVEKGKQAAVAPKAAPAASSAVGSALADIEEATTKGLSNEITQQTRTAQRAARTEDMSKILAELKAKGVPVNPNLLAEAPAQVARPGSGILLPVEKAKEIAAGEDAAKAAAAAANAPKTSKLANVANFVKGATDFKIPFTQIHTGPLLGRGLVGAGSGLQFADMLNRNEMGDTAGAAISGIGGLGTAASLLPFMPARVLGTGVGLSAEAINAYRDAMRKGKIEHGAPENYGNTDAMGMSYAQGGLVHLAKGGEPKKTDSEIKVEGDQFDKPNFEKVYSAVTKGYTAPHSDRHFEKGQIQPALNIGNPNYLLGTEAIKVFPQYQEYNKSGYYDGFNDPRSIHVSSSELNPYNLPQTLGHEAQHLQANLAWENPNKLGFIDNMRRASSISKTDELKEQIEKNYQDYLKKWKADQSNQANNFGWGMKSRGELGSYANSNPGASERYADYAGLEAQLPRGQRLVDTPLGKAVFQTPEQQSYLYQTIRPMEQKLLPQADNKSALFDTVNNFIDEYKYNTRAGKSYVDSAIKSGLSALKKK